MEDPEGAAGDEESRPDPGPGPGSGEEPSAPSEEPSNQGPAPDVGADRTPWLVPILAFLTLGIYGLYWAWTVTKEAEAFDDARQRPHGPVKWGVFTSILLILVMVGGLAAFLGIVGSAEQNLDPDAALAAQGLTLLLLVVGGLLGLVVAILFLVGFWRLWNWISFHEAELDHDALSPGLMIGIWIGAALLGWIPLVGQILAIAGPFYVYYRTQKGLNTVWDAGGRGYTPPAPR